MLCLAEQTVQSKLPFSIHPLVQQQTPFEGSKVKPKVP